MGQSLENLRKKGPLRAVIRTVNVGFDVALTCLPLRGSFNCIFMITIAGYSNLINAAAIVLSRKVPGFSAAE